MAKPSETMMDIPGLREKCPWIFDERKHPVAFVKNGELGFKTLSLHEMGRRYQSNHRRILTNGGEWRCFFTGVQCYGVPKSLKQSGSPWLHKLPWAVSLDHLVPALRGDYAPHLRDKIDAPANIVPAGARINGAFGHNPLAVKLMIRSEFAKAARIDRDDFSLQTYFDCHAVLMAVIQPLRIQGKYLWQPTTLDTTDLQRLGAAFDAEMLKVDEEFLNLPDHDRSAWIDAFVWRW